MVHNRGQQQRKLANLVTPARAHTSDGLGMASAMASGLASAPRHVRRWVMRALRGLLPRDRSAPALPLPCGLAGDLVEPLEQRVLLSVGTPSQELLFGDIEPALMVEAGTGEASAGVHMGVSPVYEPEQGNATFAAAAIEAAPPLPISETFNLASLPGATKTIYLDFLGHTTGGTTWNTEDFDQDGFVDFPTPFVTPAFDIDSNSGSFSTFEHEIMQLVWYLVAEDFAPFDVNVTTIEPDPEDLIDSGGADDRWGIRVAIGGSWSDWLGSEAGGVAIIASFNADEDAPAFVFPDNLGSTKAVADAVTHEVGHTLGLKHDGIDAADDDDDRDYFEGHGSGIVGNFLWAPIMGVGYDADIVQWSMGEYTDASNGEDDLNIITNPNVGPTNAPAPWGTDNGFGYRADDHADTWDAVTGADHVDPNAAIFASGIIETGDDKDVITFYSDGGILDLTVSPAEYGPNLDIGLRLFDSSGSLLGQSDHPDELEAGIAVDLGSLPAGRYYLEIDGVGSGDPETDGYSGYGSLGQYTVTGTIPQHGRTVSGTVYQDADASAALDGLEAGLAGIAVYHDADDDGVRDANENFTLTDANGDYTLTDLEPDAVIRQEPVSGQYLTENFDGFTLSGSDATGVNFGNAVGQGPDLTIYGIDTPFEFEGGLAIDEDYGGGIAIRVTIPAAHHSDITFDWSVSGGTASFGDASGDDYFHEAGMTGTETIPEGETAVVIYFDITDDDIYEGDETFTFTISSPENADVLPGDASRLFTILDDDIPELQIEQDFSVSEGIGSGSVTVSYEGPALDEDVTVDFDFGAGTADYGDDFLDADGTITIPAGQNSATIPFTIIDDALDELDEDFGISLSSASSNVTLSDDDFVSITILDNDATPTLTITRVNGAGADMPWSEVLEGDYGGLLLELSAASGLDISIEMALDEMLSQVVEADYGIWNHIDGTIEFEFEAGETSLYIEDFFRADIDAEAEPDEAVVLDVITVENVNYSGGPIVFDVVDRPTITSFTVESREEGNSGTTEFTFTVTLSKAIEQIAVIEYGIDFDHLGEVDYGDFVDVDDWLDFDDQLTFNPGQTTQSFTVEIQGDTDFEENESFTIELLDMFNVDYGGVLHEATATIINDDGPRLSVGNVSVIEGDDGDGMVAVVTVSTPVADPDDAITFNWETQEGPDSTTDGNDFTGTIGAGITIPAGQTSTTLTIPIVGDDEIETDETFDVVITAVTSGNATIADGHAVVTIQNDDLAQISIADQTVTEQAGGASTSLTLELSEMPADPFSFRLTSSDGTADGTSEPGSAPVGFDYRAMVDRLFTFDPEDVVDDNGTLTVTVPLEAWKDGVDEPDETLTLTLSEVQGVEAGDSIGTITIEDHATDDPPLVSVSDVTVNEAEGFAEFTISLSGPSGFSITVDVETVMSGGSRPARDGSDYTALDTITLTFVPGGPQTITYQVPIIEDGLDEHNETFDVVLSNPVNATIGDGTGVVTIVDNDEEPEITVTRVSDDPVVEGDDPARFEFIVALTSPSGKVVTVDYAALSGSAIVGDDFSANTGKLTFLPGEPTSYQFLVDVTDDSLDEEDETMRFELSNPVNATFADDATTVSATGTIGDNDEPPIVEFTESEYEIKEGENGAISILRFTVEISEPSGKLIEIPYSISDGTATHGSGDYSSSDAPVDQRLFILPGATTAEIEVNIADDATYELDEEFTVTLGTPTNADLGEKMVATGVIENDDDAPVASITGGSVLEGDSGTTMLIYTVTLNTPSEVDARLNYSRISGTAAVPDFVNSTLLGTIIIPAGEDTAVFGVTVNGDTEIEIDDTIVMRINPVRHVTAGTATATGTIINDDFPTLSVSRDEGDAVVVEGDMGTTDVAYTFSISESVPFDVSFDYLLSGIGISAADIDDLMAASGTLTIPAGTTSASVVAQIVGDEDPELDDTFTFMLSNPTSITLPAQDAIPNVVIENDDFPTISIEETASVVEGNAGTRNMAFTVTLDQPVPFPVTVNYATADGSAEAGEDYTAGASQVTFQPGQTTLRTIVVPVASDETIELDETFTVTLSGATDAILGTATSTGTIKNDDFPRVSISDGTLVEGDDGTQSMSFTLSLSEEGLEPLSVRVQTDDDTAVAGVDYTALDQVISFSPGVTQITVDVPILSEIVIENDESFSIQLSEPEHAFLGDAAGVGTIINDDFPDLTVTDIVVDEIEGETATATFIFALSHEGVFDGAPFDVQVNYATQDGSATVADGDYIATSGTLVLPAGSLSGSVTVALPADHKDEPDEMFSLVLSGAQDLDEVTGTATATIVDADDPSLITLAPINVTEGDSGTQTVTITALLSRPSGHTVTVDAAVIAALGGSAALASLPGDVVPTGTTLTFAPGETSATFEVQIAGDILDEDNETFSTLLTDAVHGTIISRRVNHTILDNDALPSISVADVQMLEGDDGSTEMTFNVVLSAISGREVRVNYATSDNSAKDDDAATAGSDYLATAGTLVIPAGATGGSISVTILGDEIVEVTERFFLNLTHPVNTTVATLHAAGRIVMDDLPEVTFSDAVTLEGDSGSDLVQFHATLSHPAPFPVLIDYAAGAVIPGVNAPADAIPATVGDDFDPASGTLIIPAGQTVGTVVVAVAGDTALEHDEAFVVSYDNIVGADLAPEEDSHSLAVILEDDVAVVSVAGATASEGASKPSLDFVVSLSAPAPYDITVSYETSNLTATTGEDYSPASGQITIPAGQTSATISVDVLDDALLELDESMQFTLLAADLSTIGTATAQGIITSDDLPGVAIGDVTVTETTGQPGGASLLVTLTEPAPFDVEIGYETQDGSAVAGDDYFAASGVVTIPAGQTSATIELAIVGDTLDEPAESFEVTLLSPGGAVITSAVGTVSIVDNDDSPLITVGNATVVEGDDGNVFAVFSISLAHVSGFDVIADYTTAEDLALAGLDYVPTAGTLTIPAGSLSTTVSVPIIGDTLAELDESLHLALSSVDNARIATGVGAAVIVNDDFPVITLQPGSIVEGDNGPGTLAVDLTLDAAAPFTITVDYALISGSAAAGEDFVAASGTVTIPAGHTSATIDVIVHGEGTIENDESFQVVLSNPLGATLANTEAEFVIHNDDLPSLTIFNADVSEGNDGSTAAGFVLALSDVAPFDVVVDYHTVALSATSGSDFAPTAGSITIPAGQLTATVDVPVIGDTLIEPDERFNLAISTEQAHVLREQGEGTVFDDDGSTQLGITGEPVVVVDENGNNVIIGIAGPGELTIEIVAVPNQQGNVRTIRVTGSTAQTRVVVRTTGNAVTSIGRIEIDGDIGLFYAPTVELTGDLIVGDGAGRGGAGRIDLYAMRDGRFEIGQSTAIQSAIIIANAFEDVVLDSGVAIRAMLIRGSWIDTNPTITRDRLIAPYVGALKVGSHLGAELDLAGDNAPGGLVLGRLQAASSASSRFSFDFGNIGLIDLGSIDAPLVVDAPLSRIDILYIRSGDVDLEVNAVGARVVALPGQSGSHIDLHFQQEIVSLLIAGDASLDLVAQRAMQIRIAGNLTSSHIHLSGADLGGRSTLGNLTVMGQIEALDLHVEHGSIHTLASVGTAQLDVTAQSARLLRFFSSLRESNIRLTEVAPASGLSTLGMLAVTGQARNLTLESAGSADSVLLGDMESSRIYVGLTDAARNDPADLPTVANPFATAATLGRFEVFSERMVDSVVAAAHIGVARIRLIQTGNGGDAFGLLAGRIDGLVANLDTGRTLIGIGLLTQSDADTQIPNLPGDFKLVVL